ncbi:hypothetical protein CPJCM30710_20940 [Clostridium polyendosporum]|uniref:DUF4363 family protein n=1 Tax=Clostridium polyendosporum TaxID=69208 RepID=A0A919S1A2_9CLOT|nr:DUF4363 family protein [Clostridium polyendosporum]GIM29428.1 hypothetical protein CPJCM30710_20940 [Clostridium polyendosporum]
MKNTIISLLIFLILFGFIFRSHNTLLTICGSISEKCETLEDLIKDDNWNKSYELAVELKDQIEESFEYISVYMNHQDLDILTNEILRLSQYTKYKNKSEALASIHVIKYSNKSIQSLQTPTIQNIF